MNVTIFPTGTGGAESAVKYLLSDTDHKKKERSVSPEIIFGDPNTFTDIANATSRKHKYTSGAIAFRDDESITPEQITSLIEAFRSTFLPGLKVDERFADFWVAHRDKGNLELHFLVANTELKTGQQLNIHPPGEKNIAFFNTFVSVMNDNFGFAQVVPDPLKIALKPFEAKSPNGKTDKKAKNDLAKALHAEISDGLIANRSQLIGFLRRRGLDIPTIGIDFITVRLPGAKKNTRLRGRLFSKDSDYAALVKEHHTAKIPKFLTPAESKDQRAKLVLGIEARTAFNARRYLTVKPGAKRDRASRAIKTPQIHEQAQIEPGRASKALDNQLSEIKAQGDSSRLTATSTPAAQLPHQVARREDDRERGGALSTVMGAAALGGLEAQIGGLSLQYHHLLLLVASAKGRRLTELKAQIAAIDQKLSALNLELQKKKAQSTNKMKPNML
jgi:hypothetical protein